MLFGPRTPRIQYPGNDSGQVWLKLAQWFQRRRFLKKFTTDDGRRRTDDGRKVMAKAHPGLWPGELKMKNIKILKILRKKGNNSQTGSQIFFKIAG